MQALERKNKIIDEERDISPAEIVEHLERARFLEQETVVSKDVTSHLTLARSSCETDWTRARGSDILE